MDSKEALLNQEQKEAAIADGKLADAPLLNDNELEDIAGGTSPENTYIFSTIKSKLSKALKKKK